MKTAALALLVFSGLLVLSRLEADDTSPAAVPDYSYQFRRGGSFSLEPALLIPDALLDKVYNNSLGYNADFDVGVSPDISIVFGAGYFNLQGQQNSDDNLLMAPFWAGIKSKNQFLPMAEFYWEADAAGYYERSYLIQTSSGSQQNLDWGACLGAGFDIWWTRWLLTGIDAKFHLVVENGQVFPFTQLGLRFGIRG